jgi:hypothetical protein
MHNPVIPEITGVEITVTVLVVWQPGIEPDEPSVYVTIAVPVAVPVTTPDAEPIPISEEPVLQTPPAGVMASVVELPTQTDDVILTSTGSALTVIIAVAAQPPAV